MRGKYAHRLLVESYAWSRSRHAAPAAALVVGNIIMITVLIVVKMHFPQHHVVTATTKQPVLVSDVTPSRYSRRQAVIRRPRLAALSGLKLDSGQLCSHLGRPLGFRTRPHPGYLLDRQGPRSPMDTPSHQ